MAPADPGLAWAPIRPSTTDERSTNDVAQSRRSNPVSTYPMAIDISTDLSHTWPVANVVGERFQITIDKQVREQLGIQPGDQAVEWIEDGRLVVYFMPKPHMRSLLGILRKPGVEPVTDWRAFKDEAWAARSAEIVDVLRADSERHREPADE